MYSPDKGLSFVFSGHLHEEVIFDYDKSRQSFLRDLKLNDPPYQLMIVDRLLEILSDERLATTKAREWGIHDGEEYEDPQPGFDLVFAPLIAPLEALKLELVPSLGGRSQALGTAPLIDWRLSGFGPVDDMMLLHDGTKRSLGLQASSRIRRRTRGTSIRASTTKRRR